ncbi:MAG TPA: hypothetical protein VGC70_02690 [Burkholderiales bacterium]
MSAKLRVGVVLASAALRGWQRVLLERIASLACVELALVAIEGDARVRDADVEPRARRTTPLQGIAARVFESAYRRLERGICCEHDAFAMCDGTPVLAGIPRIDRVSRNVDGTQGYEPGEIERIRALNLDVLLQLHSGAPAAEMASAARYGLWYLDGRDYPLRSGAPAGFWEVYFARPVTRMQLIKLNGRGEKHVLACSSAGTHPLSVKLNRSNAYWNALSLVPRKLAQLHTRGEEALHAHKGTPLKATADVSALAPDLTAMALQVGRNIGRRARERFKRTFNTEQWILLYHVGDGPCTRIRDFKRIVPPSDRYWADPHVVCRHGEHYVFIEEYSFKNAKGHISVIRIDKNGSFTKPTIVLERPYHLSYPFVFDDAGELYMVPESMQNRTVELYRCVEFPHRWEFVCNLLEGISAVDSTLLHHDGKWWLFANVLENEGGSASEELFVYYADALLSGNWTPHPRNPVISDVTRARPAGPIQLRDGQLYRPSQDCSVRYGYAIRINQIAVLSKEDYAETEISRIKPDWSKNVLGTHTLAYAAGLTVVDALLVRPKFGQHH